MEFYKTDVSCNHANIIVLTPENSLSNLNTIESCIRITSISWGTRQVLWTNGYVKKKNQARRLSRHSQEMHSGLGSRRTLVAANSHRRGLGAVRLRIWKTWEIARLARAVPRAAPSRRRPRGVCTRRCPPAVRAGPHLWPSLEQL